MVRDGPGDLISGRRKLYQISQQKLAAVAGIGLRRLVEIESHVGERANEYEVDAIYAALVTLTEAIERATRGHHG